jgi:YHS domain-containing protein
MRIARHVSAGSPIASRESPVGATEPGHPGFPPTISNAQEEPMAKDPVCGMEVNESDAQFTANHEGKTFYFCSDECKQKFNESPQQYANLAA